VISPRHRRGEIAIGSGPGQKTATGSVTHLAAHRSQQEVSGQVLWPDEVFTFGRELLHREIKTEASDATLPLPGICVTALRMRQEEQAEA
jgi:hypothetical protein